MSANTSSSAGDSDTGKVLLFGGSFPVALYDARRQTIVQSEFLLLPSFLADLMDSYSHRAAIQLRGQDKVIAGENSVFVYDLIQNTCSKLPNIYNTNCIIQLDEPDNRLVFGSINSVVFFDADKLIPLNTIVLQASGANYTAVAQVSETLIACSCSEVIEIYNIESLTKVKQFVIHSDVTTSIIKLPTGNMASAGNDKTVRVWDIDGNILYTLEHSSNVTSIVTFESFLVTTEQGKTIRFWDIQNWQCKKHLSSISHAYDLFYDMKVWNDTLFIVGGVTYSYTTQGGLKQIDRNKMCCLPIKNNGKLGEVWTEKPTTPLDSIPVAPKR